MLDRVSPRARLCTLALAVLFALVLVGRQRPSEAQGQTKTSTEGVEAMQGLLVAVFFTDYPMSDNRQIIQLAGEVTAVKEHGIWLKTKLRLFAKGSKEEEYVAPCYVPFTAVAYVKVIQPK